jgi:hypothetical protein
VPEVVQTIDEWGIGITENGDTCGKSWKYFFISFCTDFWQLVAMDTETDKIFNIS